MHLEFMRSTARQMPAVPNAGEITSLMVWHCKFDSLESLGSFTKLRALKIAGYPDSSLETLKRLKQLQWLSVLHLPEVRDLEPLGALRKLISLELATQPSWDSSGKRQVVKSLDPLAKLPRLAYLALLGVVPESKSLVSLEGCPSLVTARFSGYPATEVKRFYGASTLENAHVPSFPEA